MRRTGSSLSGCPRSRRWGRTSISTSVRQYDNGGILLSVTDVGGKLDDANRKAGQQELLRRAQSGPYMRMARRRRGAQWSAACQRRSGRRASTPKSGCSFRTKPTARPSAGTYRAGPRRFSATGNDGISALLRRCNEASRRRHRLWGWSHGYRCRTVAARRGRDRFSRSFAGDVCRHRCRVRAQSCAGAPSFALPPIYQVFIPSHSSAGWRCS